MVTALMNKKKVSNPMPRNHRFKRSLIFGRRQDVLQNMCVCVCLPECLYVCLEDCEIGLHDIHVICHFIFKSSRIRWVSHRNRTLCFVIAIWPIIIGKIWPTIIGKAWPTANDHCL